MKIEYKGLGNENGADLSEISQPINVKFAMGQLKSNVITQFTPWFKCRDYLSDCVYNYYTGKVVEIYGFQLSKDMLSKKPNLALMVKAETVKQCDNIKLAISLLNKEHSTYINTVSIDATTLILNLSSKKFNTLFLATLSDICRAAAGLTSFTSIDDLYNQYKSSNPRMNIRLCEIIKNRNLSASYIINVIIDQHVAIRHIDSLLFNLNVDNIHNYGGVMRLKKAAPTVVKNGAALRMKYRPLNFVLWASSELLNLADV